MLSLNHSLISKLILVLILLGSVSSCKQKRKVVFHYSNGAAIKDSELLGFLNKQLPVLVPEYDSTLSLDVQTCLDQKTEKKLKRYFRKDSLRKVSAMLVLDNKTGDVLYCKNSNYLSVYSQRFPNMKMYGVLMSFENGVKLTDTFSWTGKYSGQKRTREIASLYRMTPPTLDYKYPFDTYSCGEWTKFLNKLDVSTKESDCADGDWFPRFFFTTSLFELVKTGSLIERTGFVKPNNLFGTIKDSDGNTIHVPDLLKGKILKTESCVTLKKVLKRNPSKRIQFNYPISLHTEKGFKNGMVFSTEKVTIGFVASSKSVNNDKINEEIALLASLF